MNGNWGVAAEQFRQAYAKNPNSKEILRNLINAQYKVGLLALEKGDVNYAVTQFQSLCYLSPDSKEFIDYLALAKQKLQEQHDKADAQRRDNITYDNALAQYELAVSFSKKGDWATAEKYFETAMKLYPGEPAFRQYLAIAKGHMAEQAWFNNDHRGALEILKRALELDPANEYAKRNIPLMQKSLDQQQQDKVAATNVLSDVNKIAEDVKNAEPTGNLGFKDYNEGKSPFGIPQSKPTIADLKPRDTRIGNVKKDPGHQLNASGKEGIEKVIEGKAQDHGGIETNTVLAPALDAQEAKENKIAAKHPELVPLLNKERELKNRSFEVDNQMTAIKNLISSTPPTDPKQKELVEKLSQTIIEQTKITEDKKMATYNKEQAMNSYKVEMEEAPATNKPPVKQQ